MRRGERVAVGATWREGTTRAGSTPARGDEPRVERACLCVGGCLPSTPIDFGILRERFSAAATPARWQAITKRRTLVGGTPRDARMIRRRWCLCVRVPHLLCAVGVRRGSSNYAMHRIDRHAATHAHHIATAFRGSATVGSSGATRQNGSRPRVPCANKMIDSAHITGREARVEKERGHYTGVPIGTAWPWTGLTMPVLSAMT